MPKPMRAVPAILPSLLSADSMRLGEEVAALMAAGITSVHLDVMDNHYVPNLTYGPEIARGLRQHFPSLLIDVHLMTSSVDELIVQFAQAGAARIAIHADSSRHLDRSLQLIRDEGCLAGLALNPSTPPEQVAWCVHRLDFVLIMTVNPGFAGQQLITPVLAKISQLHASYPQLRLCVDGGINLANITEIAHRGATEFVLGSALFSHPNYAMLLQQLQTTLDGVNL